MCVCAASTCLVFLNKFRESASYCALNTSLVCDCLAQDENMDGPISLKIVRSRYILSAKFAILCAVVVRANALSQASLLNRWSARCEKEKIPVKFISFSFVAICFYILQLCTA